MLEFTMGKGRVKASDGLTYDMGEVIKYQKAVRGQVRELAAALANAKFVTRSGEEITFDPATKGAIAGVLNELDTNRLLKRGPQGQELPKGTMFGKASKEPRLSKRKVVKKTGKKKKSADTKRTTDSDSKSNEGKGSSGEVLMDEANHNQFEDDEYDHDDDDDDAGSISNGSSIEIELEWMDDPEVSAHGRHDDGIL
jgi:hypothetical protein